MEFEISCAELKQKLDNRETLVLLDVREPEEFAIANIGGKLIPLSDLPARVTELNPEDYIVVYCHHGVRSAHAVAFLRQCGYEKTQNMRGGIARWSAEIDSNVPTY